MNSDSKAKHTAWKVKTNVHPETNGDPWGWVGRDVFGSGDAIPGVSITWTGAKGRDIARLIAEAPTLLSELEASTSIMESVLHLFGESMAMSTKFGLTSQIESNKEILKKIEG